MFIIHSYTQSKRFKFDSNALSAEKCSLIENKYICTNFISIRFLDADSKGIQNVCICMCLRVSEYAHLDVVWYTLSRFIAIAVFGTRATAKILNVF